MTDPFAGMFAALSASDLGKTITYTPQIGSPVPDIRILERRPDTEGDFGQVRVAHDVRVFEIRVADLPGVGPARGDQITAGADTYQVQSTPHKDQLGLVWVIDAYKEVS